MITTKNICNQNITLFEGDYITKKILQHGVYDTTGLAFIKSILKALDSPIVLDIGANVGNHTLIMSLFSKMIYSFEPQKDVFQLLQKNLHDNHIQNVKAFNFGLSDTNEILDFYQNNSGNRGASGFDSRSIKSNDLVSTKLEVCLGDEVLKQEKLAKLDFIKIDVEGFEPNVLKGLAGTIKTNRPIILLEWLSPTIKDDFARNKIEAVILNEYKARSLMSNYDSSFFTKSTTGKIKKEWYKLTHGKKWILNKFEPNKRYSSVVFFPAEKEHFIDSLPQAKIKHLRT